MVVNQLFPKQKNALIVFVNQSTISSRIGWAENTHFLEQFRYTLVASQLLNEHPNPTTYQRQEPSLPATNSTVQLDAVSFSLFGISVTTAAAFALAWAIHSIRVLGLGAIGYRRVCLVTIIVSLTGIGLYFYFRRQWLQYLRSRAVRNASMLVSNAQGFDTAASSAITFVQEVELVSRGYRMYVDSSLSCGQH